MGRKRFDLEGLLREELGNEPTMHERVEHAYVQINPKKTKEQKKAANSLVSLAKKVINNYANKPQELYSAMVAVAAQLPASQQTNFYNDLDTEVQKDEKFTDRGNSYTFVPTFVRDLLSPLVREGEASVTTIKKAFEYIESKREYQGSDQAQKLLSYDEAFGREPLSMEVLTQATDPQQAQKLVRKYDIVAIKGPLEGGSPIEVVTNGSGREETALTLTYFHGRVPQPLQQALGTLKRAI